MPQSPLPAEVISLPETLTKFREHAQKGNYALAQRYHEQVRAVREDAKDTRCRKNLQGRPVAEFDE